MIWKTLAVTASVMAATFVTAAPANATSWINYGNAAEGHWGSGGGLESYMACDTKTDGYGARMDWHTDTWDYNGSISDTDGNNGICFSSFVNVPEGRGIYYRVCLLSNGFPISCSGYIGDVS